MCERDTNLNEHRRTTCLKKRVSLVEFQMSNWHDGIFPLRQRTGQIDDFGDLYQDTRTLPPLTWQTGHLEITQLTAAGTVHRNTESQNGRVGRDLWGSPSPTLLPKQGHLQ